jgi:hypothetical protein
VSRVHIEISFPTFILLLNPILSMLLTAPGGQVATEEDMEDAACYNSRVVVPLLCFQDRTFTSINAVFYLPDTARAHFKTDSQDHFKTGS